ncbi:hypothetical protein [Aestuariispira insulae]|uniref:Lipoprotein n=1 Tax=Aestuariispira insulae TaxID=1461337 RepID=A0A3D9HW07_9PROT|nr:hypothetical protein [Aestuariispira insulae]RED53610.1 hypothetical protein DFP90_101401 [Aestuariispira insulae]
MKIRLAVPLSLGLILSSCANEPSITESYGVDSPGGNLLVSVCYSATNTTRQEIENLAAKSCPAGTTGISVAGHNTLLNQCPLSKKNRVTFECHGYPVTAE